MKYDVKYLNISLKLSYKKLLKELMKNTSWILIWFCRYYNFRCLMTMGFMFFGWSVRDLRESQTMDHCQSDCLQYCLRTYWQQRGGGTNSGCLITLKFNSPKCFFAKLSNFTLFSLYLFQKKFNSLEMFEYQRNFDEFVDCIPFFVSYHNRKYTKCKPI